MLSNMPFRSVLVKGRHFKAWRRRSLFIDPNVVVRYRRKGAGVDLVVAAPLVPIGFLEVA
jgi:hypothetical protein